MKQLTIWNWLQCWWDTTVYNNAFKGLHSYRSYSSQRLLWASSWISLIHVQKTVPIVNNQKDVILCDLMMELNKRKYILHVYKLHALSYPFLSSYVNRLSVGKNWNDVETFCCVYINHASMNLTKVWNWKLDKFVLHVPNFSSDETNKHDVPICLL